MAAYIIRRLLLMIPTLWAIITINFFVIQTAPGGPVEQAMAQSMGLEGERLDRITGANQGDVQSQAAESSQYRGARGLDPEIIAEIEKRFGFDKPIHERYWDMLKSYIMFDFGDSLFKSGSVVDLVLERMPVTISIGLWSTLLIYMISIPLGISKALRHGHQFDRWTSTVLSIAYAIPGFLFAILLVILFAGGTYFDWFPLRGLVSDNWDTLSWPDKILDYFWHMALPITANVIGGFATLTLLTKNSFLDEINKQYVMTAKAKGLTQSRVLYKHVFRNAMLIVISGFPAAFVSIFFTGALLIEVIFSLEGLGLLGFEAIMQRDYPIVFSTLYVFTLIGLLISLLTDLTYTWVDPRIDFEKRG
ncbi:microcin C ABC transporter permease YejB [Hahella sp. KA22]|uniref:microcin C ABC transporter permease YejB n=1 Tax=unclassified Hahella TaxID=2624107 RepID=UPI000FDE4F43|nr:MULTISPECIES: microcin C ABC transporter permease YejB [unclassified Hahella]AZZ91782.1 microcin C ABC transporter permease YejB [Hahella sp. KA22]QAY55152.1 microcin C ABC transporter permease YejB [Hahella sp. KA22]WLQ15565.1 microcin C ABC transporter permease YejB [Hahella sp. HNIBRBA332]